MKGRARLALPLGVAALAVLAWALYPSGPTDPLPPHANGPVSVWRANFEHAADGDSLTVRRADSGQRVELRLYGVDAPENGQAYGQASRRSLVHMLEGRILDVEAMENDQYGRVVAVVHTAGDPASVNERQIERGMAWYYGHFCRAPFCSAWENKEREARAGRVGLWRDKAPVPPREWRRAHHR